MEKFQKVIVFWLLLVMSVIVPSIANAQVRTKKLGWSAQITANGAPVGAASIIRTIRCTVVSATQCTTISDTISYRVDTRGYQCAHNPCQAGEIRVTKATLLGTGTPNAGPWERDLCDGADTCTYNDTRDGELALEGVLEPWPIGIFQNLDGVNGGSVTIRLNDGTLGVGTFVRIP